MNFNFFTLKDIHNERINIILRFVLLLVIGVLLVTLYSGSRDSFEIEVPTDPSSKEALKVQKQKIEDLELKIEGLVAQTEELHGDIHRLEEGKEMKQNTNEKEVEKKKKVSIGDTLASFNKASWREGRAETWASLWNEFGFKRGAEIGVWNGEFAKVVLDKQKTLQEYILVDPWQHLADWNKPFNTDDNEFEQIFNTAMANTLHGPHGHKVKVIRALSEDGARQIADASLDYVYIDGDHTYNGAMKDLQNWAPKVKAGGLVCGDDFLDGTQHGDGYAPTGVKSAVTSYARSIAATVHDLGNDQFAFQMTESSKGGPHF